MAEFPTQRKLRKIRQEIAECRNSINNTTYRDLESIAKKLGRRMFGGRGKEPTWISDLLPTLLTPVSIPRKPMAPNTKRNIITDLEGDVDTLEAYADDEEEIN